MFDDASSAYCGSRVDGFPFSVRLYIKPEPSPLSSFPQELNETAQRAAVVSRTAVFFIILSPFIKQAFARIILTIFRTDLIKTSSEIVPYGIEDNKIIININVNSRLGIRTQFMLVRYRLNS